MQSARRKRERAENDVEDDDSSARRGAKSQKKQEIGVGLANAAAKVATEVTPQLREDNKAATRQAQPLPGVVDATEGPNGGNDDSAKTTVPTAIDTSSDPEQSTSATGDAGTSSKTYQTDGTLPGASTGTREQQISALIAHRKILLGRMKQCKLAAGSRIQYNADKRNRQLLPKETKEGGDSVSKQSSNPLDSDTEEIQSYHKTCRKANEANRRQKAQANEAAAEKRSSVSLRRGSSVGKRMNAALSSLGGASSSLIPSNPITSMPTSSASISEGGSSAQQNALLPGANMPLPNSKHASLKSSQQRVLPVKSSSSVGNSTINQKHGGQQARKRSSATQKASKSYQGASASINSQSSSSSTLPLHAGAAASGLPFNRLAYPKVDFPEARALREKRDIIRTKLNALIHERLERIQRTSDTNKRNGAGSQLKSHPSLREKPSLEEYRLSLPRMVLERSVNAPSKLPRRQKTHWDYLLEEMRWLATDFVEERKWKAASARILASAVAANRLNAVAPTVSALGQERTTDKACIELQGGRRGDHARPLAADASVTKEGPTISGESLEELGARAYSHLGSSGKQVAQSVAKVISDMVAELWAGSIECGMSATTDESLVSALGRHEKLRKAVGKGEELGDSELSVPGEGKGLSELDEDKENGEEVLEGAQKFVELSQEGREAVDEITDSNPLSNQEISARIESASDRINGRTARRSRAKPTRDNASLGTEQRRAAEFVEFAWAGDEAIAPCLNGPTATGKTVFVCYMLWKRRSVGPQLVVCSPSRLIRWVHELERFKELELNILGLQCGLSSTITQAKARSQFHQSDVVICEFSSLLCLAEETQEVRLDLSVFQTVVLDARFPTESIVDLRGQNSVVRATGTAHIPPEIVSHRWWANLLKSLRSSSTRRLLIDNFDSTFMGERDGINNAELSERQRLDSSAAMAAFVVGPDLFRCDEARSVQHKVVSWAKYVAKEDNSRRRPRYDEVRGAIADAASAFRYTLERESFSKVDRQKEGEWDVRLCPLSVSQRSAYEACCIGVRGSLAFGNITDYADSRNRPEHAEHAVQGLMKLRRVCFHSRIDDVLGSSSAFGSEILTKKDEVSVSQPQADVAIEILSGSAKLRELVTILVEDCGFSEADDSVIKHATEFEQARAPRKKAKKKPPKKKVAILAVLPEVQLLTSMLLNAIGINHELLGSSLFRNHGEYSVEASAQSGSHAESHLDSSLSWIESQLSLLRFSTARSSDIDDNDSATIDMSSLRSSCDIVVTSPVLVGADNGGLGIEAADIIICLDEDWSGRDTILSERILSKALFAYAMVAESDTKRDGGRTFVRLVCEKTCEHVFLSDLDGDDNDVEDFDMPSIVRSTDCNGLLTSPTEPQAFDIPAVDEVRQPDENALEGHFRFPASSLLRFRGAVLSTVLLPAKHIPPVFATGEPIRFLPFQDWEETTDKKRSLSIELVRSLIAEEDRCRELWTVLCSPEGHENRRDESRKESKATTVIPPFPADFPSAVMTRHDTMAASSRLYVDRFGKYLVATAGSLSPSVDSSTLVGPSALGVVSNGGNSAMPVNNGQLADSWQKSGLSFKPVDVVPSLLSYGASGAVVRTTTDATTGGPHLMQPPNVNKANKESADTIGPTAQSVSATPRTNAFSALYCSSREFASNVNDGNQGLEPLAYFPPLFPSLLTASDRALSDVARRDSFQGGPMALALSQHNYLPTGIAELSGRPLKRKEPPVAYPMSVASKRPRFGKSMSGVEVAHAPPYPPSESGGTGTALLSRPAPSSKSDGSGMPFTDVQEDAGAMEKCSRLTDPSIVTEDEGSQWDQFDLGEDYGLLGVGALAADDDSARYALSLSVNALGYTKWRDPYEANGVGHEVFSSAIACDAEEAEANIHGEIDGSFLDSMLLFVAKQAPSVYAGLSASQLGFSSANAQWAQSRSQSVIHAPGLAIGLPNGLGPNGKESNSAGVGKKGKRKSQSQSTMAVGAFARVNPADMSKRSMNPYMGSSSLHSAKGRESYRSKVLASILARQGGGRDTLFQVPSFLLASIRIRDDVLRRVLNHSQASPSGSHNPYLVPLPWTRACYKLSSSAKKTGDSALQISKKQQIKMSTAPGPVDFGPFVAGYIASTYAICGAIPRSSVPGIALPMGVKIPRRPGELQVHGWTEAEDSKTKESVLRYGLNWHMVAASVNSAKGKQVQHDSVEDNRSRVILLPTRSPEQCHERWIYLVEQDPRLAGALRDAERTRHRHAVESPPPDEVDCAPASLHTKAHSAGTSMACKAGASLSLVVSSDLLVDEDDDGDQIMDQVEATPKHSFAAVRRAAKKRIEVSLPIPGCVDGGKPTLVSSHPSHIEAVQAVATNSGREVWPLQVLEMVDKQRLVTSASVPNGRSPGRQSSPNRQQRLPQSFQVPHSAMAPVLPSPSRSPQAQPFPGVSSPHGGPGIARGTPLRGPPSSQSRSQ